MPKKTNEEVSKEFKQLVNMTAKSLKKFLTSDESRSVGRANAGQSESVGHKSGKKIVEILNSKGELSEDDFAHMRKVVSYIKRHIAQKPQKENIDSSRWRFSFDELENDPLKSRLRISLWAAGDTNWAGQSPEYSSE